MGPGWKWTSASPPQGLDPIGAGGRKRALRPSDLVIAAEGPRLDGAGSRSPATTEHRLVVAASRPSLDRSGQPKSGRPLNGLRCNGSRPTTQTAATPGQRNRRSASANPNNATATNPFAVKKALFTFDRSFGFTTACSYASATATTARPTQ